jgi:hypothetical protein
MDVSCKRVLCQIHIQVRNRVGIYANVRVKINVQKNRNVKSIFKKRENSNNNKNKCLYQIVFQICAIFHELCNGSQYVAQLLEETKLFFFYILLFENCIIV